MSQKMQRRQFFVVQIKVKQLLLFDDINEEVLSEIDEKSKVVLTKSFSEKDDEATTFKIMDY